VLVENPFCKKGFPHLSQKLSGQILAALGIAFLLNNVLRIILSCPDCLVCAAKTLGVFGA
jgi:hypothetical protein